MKTVKTIKGTHDILPADVIKWQTVENALRDVFSAYTCREIRTPIFEETRLFSRGVGEFTDIVSKEMYSFEDKGGHSLTLRPELTASVARSYIQHHYEQEAPLHKLWYIGPLFRQEKPQAGRQRQFHQYGIEFLGASYPEADAEVINLACDVYKHLGLKKWKLHLNSIGSNESRQKYIGVLKDALAPHLDKFCTTCQGRYENNILRLFDCKSDVCKQLMAEHAPSILDHLSEEDSLHFEQVKSLVLAAGNDFIIDNTLVRGLDYYTRTTFEIKGTELGAQDALCGGGRYDRLISDLGGKETPAVGFAAGMERLVMAMDSEDLFSDVSRGPILYIAPMDPESYKGCLPLVNALRKEGIPVYIDVMRRSVKAMMRDAHRQQARYTVVVGDREIETEKIQLKDMASKENVELSFEECVKFLADRNKV